MSIFLKTANKINFLLLNQNKKYDIRRNIKYKWFICRG